MRRIDLHKVAQDASWDVAASAAESKVASGGLVNSYSSVWGDAKQRLKEVSHGKCWYCEALQGRSDNAVDHFRPKSLYPWLAFKLSNYRYACTFCNSRRMNPDTGESAGKGDHFPLFNMPRATDPAQVKKEDPILLDPCHGLDPGLLDFLDDGTPCAKHPNDEKKSTRAKESIHYYHLNHPALRESRRQLGLDIKDWIDAAEVLYSKIGSDTEIDLAFSKLVESIGRAVVEGAEFSVFARRVVLGHRDKLWVEDLLLCA